VSDAIALVRALGALLAVLGLLCGALWAVRRFNIALPGTGTGRPDRRLAVIERLSLDPRRSLALFRRDGVEHLVLIAPEGHLLIESRIDAAVQPAAGRTLALPLPAIPRDSFAALIDRLNRRTRDKGANSGAAAEPVAGPSQG
jgi:hypothetical protein